MSNAPLIVLIVAVVLSLAVLILGQRYAKVDPTQPQVKFLGLYSPVLTRLKYGRLPRTDWRLNLSLAKYVPSRATWQTALEIAVIIAWAMWVGRAYLDFDPHTWPTGAGEGSQGLSNYFWVNVRQCGLCALWRGSLEGGVPALADVYGSPLHPVVALTTLLWDPIIGVKVTMVFALAVAGLAQWWLARTLRLGVVARMWCGLMATAGGHLAILQDEGAFTMFLSLAGASLALAAAVSLGINRRRRDALALAVAGALVAISGGGYYQLAVLVTAPAFIVFVLNRQLSLRPVWREYVLAVGICLLLIGVWAVPIAHFWPNFSKVYAADPEFGYAESLSNIPLNFVMQYWKDWSNFLGTHPGDAATFIGWTPIILAVLCLWLARREDYSALVCLAATAGLLMWFGSAVPLRWLAKWFPFFYGFTFPTIMTGLAVVPILALAGYGLDGLWRLTWPRLAALDKQQGNPLVVVDFRWGVVIALIPSVTAVYSFGQTLLGHVDRTPQYEVIAGYWVPSTQWVQVPDWVFVPPALSAGYKVTNFYREIAGFARRESPKPYLAVCSDPIPPEVEKVRQWQGQWLCQNPQNEYAYVDLGDGTMSPCNASGTGGDLTVHCKTDRDGILVVEENSWTGWSVWRDSTPAALIPASSSAYWLRTNAPSGDHTYDFQYRPWDVWVGLAVTIAGIVLAASLWFRADPKPVE